MPSGLATFGALRCAHQTGIRFYKLDRKIFTFSVKKGFFRTPGLPARIEAKLPSACIVAAVAGVANHFGYGPFTAFPLSHHNEPFMPGDRTCDGGAYTFQIPGPLTVQENVVIPLKVQGAASIRCIYAYLQQGTTDGQSAYLVKISRDGGATWEPLEYMGIAQSIPTPFKTTYDFLLTQGYGRPETLRLPYNDFGIVLYRRSLPARTHRLFRPPPMAQTASASRWASSYTSTWARRTRSTSKCSRPTRTTRRSRRSSRRTTPWARRSARPSGPRRSSTKATTWPSTSWMSPRPTRARI